MDLGIRGKNALVIGAGSGLGAACAIALASEGVRVVLVGRRAETLNRTRDVIAAISDAPAALPMVWDVSEPDIAAAQIVKIKEMLGGPISILINNTGGPPPTSASGQLIASWEVQFKSLVLSLIAVTDAVLPQMRQLGYGRVITIASSGVIAPIPNLAFSNTLRSALVGWSKTLSREVAPHGITVNTVLPGRIDTDRLRSLNAAMAEREHKSEEAVAAESIKNIPLGRYGQPAEFAAAVAFLASTQAAYITGSMLRVDGGLISSV